LCGAAVAERLGSLRRRSGRRRGRQRSGPIGLPLELKGWVASSDPASLATLGAPPAASDHPPSSVCVRLAGAPRGASDLDARAAVGLLRVDTQATIRERGAELRGPAPGSRSQIVRLPPGQPWLGGAPLPPAARALDERPSARTASALHESATLRRLQPARIDTPLSRSTFPRRASDPPRKKSLGSWPVGRTSRLSVPRAPKKVFHVKRIPISRVISGASALLKLPRLIASLSPALDTCALAQRASAQ
jgi:hypothetical protein